MRRRSSAKPPPSAFRIRARASIVVVATPPPDGAVDAQALLAACREKLPAFMVPAKVDIREGPLPRNPNGKIDRKTARRGVGRCACRAAKGRAGVSVD